MKILSAFFAGIVLWCGAALAQDSGDGRSSLRGLKAIGVSVGDFDPSLECEGIQKSQLQSDVEERLSKAGIKVLAKEDLPKTPGNPRLQVSLSVMKLDSQSLHVYRISIEFVQDVVLRRNPGQTCPAVTWGVSVEGTGESVDMQRIRTSLTGLVDRFISAYQSVNPN